MQTNNHKIVDYDLVLDAKFGKEGTPERIQAEEAAYSFYSGQMSHGAWHGVINCKTINQCLALGVELLIRQHITTFELFLRLVKI